MITRIKCTLSDGKEYTFKGKNELHSIDENKEALFLFSDMNIYQGYTNGEILLDDEIETFIIRNPKLKFSIGMPYKKLMGWTYIKQRP